MSFGKICATLLPTLAGDFWLHALPESVPMGRVGERQMIGLLEHAVITPKNYNPNAPTKIHVIDENVFEHLFKGQHKDEELRIVELLKMLNERENEILVVLRSVDTPGAVALKNAAPQPEKVSIAPPATILAEITRQLGIKDVTSTVRQAHTQGQKSVPATVATQYGTFNVKTMDVAERMKMPAIAWKALFPDAGDAFAEGKQPLVAEGQQPMVYVPKKHVAFIREQKSKDGNLPMVRIHSSCFTSICGSISCDCGQQFDQALKMIAANGGVMLHHDAEGRGAGLALKVLMYELKRNGMSTYEAMHFFDLNDDERGYREPVQLVNKIVGGPFLLITNNLDKMDAVRKLHADVVGTVEIIAEDIHPQMVKYLRDKQGRSHPGYGKVIADKAEL